MVLANRKAVLILTLSVIILASSMLISTASAQGDSPISIFYSGHVSFSILGAEGLYPAKSVATVRISSAEGVRLHFKATPLEYQGAAKEKYVLDVTYSVSCDGGNYSFKPQDYLTIKELKGGEHELTVSGVVQIKSIEGQAAGPYRGTICVTVCAP